MHVPNKSETMPNKSEPMLGACIPIDNTNCQKYLLELSMTYELSLFCCIPIVIYHVTRPIIISAIKTHCMIIEDIIHFDG